MLLTGESAENGTNDARSFKAFPSTTTARDFLQEHEDIKEKVMKSLKESDDLLRKARLLLKDSEGRSEGLCEKPKEVSEAEAVARRQLQHVKQNPSREAREKGFKDLLRVWHPDKNPENPEVATVVFQMLQAERGGI